MTRVRQIPTDGYITSAHMSTFTPPYSQFKSVECFCLRLEYRSQLRQWPNYLPSIWKDLKKTHGGELPYVISYVFLAEDRSPLTERRYKVFVDATPKTRANIRVRSKVVTHMTIEEIARWAEDSWEWSMRKPQILAYFNSVGERTWPWTEVS